MNDTSRFIVPVLLVSMAACSGSKGIPPVIANGPPPADLNDIVGITFPLRVMRAVTPDFFTTAEVSRDTYSVRFTSDTTAVLTTNLGTVNLADDGFGSWAGSANGYDYDMQFQGIGFDYSEGLIVTASDGVSTLSQSYGYFGFETPQSTMDVAQANDWFGIYNGESFLIVTVDGEVDGQPSIATLTVDFGLQSVSGPLFTGGDGTTLNLLNGQIVGNDITGNVGVSGPGAANSVINTSDVDGTFFGLDALELNGTFEGSGLQAGLPLEFVGYFWTID